MSKIGQQLSKLRNATPRHVQWILMGAAFVVAIVLVVLLVSGKNKTRLELQDGPEDVVVVPEIRIEPNDTIDWSDTYIGDTQTQEVKFGVKNNVKLKITDISLDNNTDITLTQSCTTEEFLVSDSADCIITVKFNPTKVIDTTTANLNIKWATEDTGLGGETKDAVKFVISSRKNPNAVPEPVVEEQPKNEVIPEQTDIEQEFKNDLDIIAPSIDFDTLETEPQDEPEILDEPEEPEPVAETPAPAPAPKAASKKQTSEKPAAKKASKACSDFAFAGYGLNGVQNGWIRPRGGAYYFYPFTDKNCENPTGIYDANTGFVMDISNPSKKIGTDAEHIRFVSDNKLPELKNSPNARAVKRVREKTPEDYYNAISGITPTQDGKPKGIDHVFTKKPDVIKYDSGDEDAIYSSEPQDRTFLLRQYKPIPATIVSDVLADKDMLTEGLPVRATVDRNVYSDNGRTVIIPTGTLMLGKVTGNLPGPYKAVGRMDIKWYQFIRPDGVVFSFNDQKNPFSADAQGRRNVPGHGSTDYVQQFFMPMLTALVPAAINMIAPISDRFVNQIDLDNNTVVQSGTVRSSEMAKNEIITAWNNVATKLLVDMMDNTVPPFSIPAGTRITVFSPVDLGITCGSGEEGDTRKCAIHNFGKRQPEPISQGLTESEDEAERVGQVRSLMSKTLFSDFCEVDEATGAQKAKTDPDVITKMKQQGYNFATVDFYCRSLGTYNTKNSAKQKAVFQNQKEQFKAKYNPSGGEKIDLSQENAYTTEILGLKYNEDGSVQDPFKSQKPDAPVNQDIVPDQVASLITCADGSAPDVNGCCTGETLQDDGSGRMVCCPINDPEGDCFDPITY
ncbi:MAG: hypothetical protein K5912_01535 [Alphaproteobacteria bacterium]|nr:hypothetical protein [Alphaproteobacteria bacterium]